MRTTWAISALIITFGLPQTAFGQSAPDPRAGTSFLAPAVYSEEDDARILKQFEGLRVADVSDGMDLVGLAHVGRVDESIAPLWKDEQKYTHRIIGIAVTARYVPTQQPTPSVTSTEEYDRWAGDWYSKRSSEPFIPLLRAGSVLVIEEHGHDVGSIGSNNILTWKSKGCVGVITTSSARDTDEIITQRVPLYLRQPGRGIRPGRNEIESVNRPIVCGGALVMPGDVIVADGDGVIVVPRAFAEPVAKYAHTILEGDKKARRAQYEKLGLPLDDSVK